ncbi:MAG: hypothetical protein NC429_14895 [Lachnospiraceae bacterium]|nr:hypothetical protein [Lachnospiraceae bacterium]
MKNRYRLAAGLVLLTLSAVGCSGKEPEESPALSVENVQDIEDASKGVQGDTLGKNEQQNETEPENANQPEHDTQLKDETRSENTSQPKEEAESGEKEESEYKVFPMKEGEESLSGKVRSIGENSVVISKIFIEDGKDGKGSIAVLPGEGSREEELVTVNFTDDTVFHHWTIKSGGADIDMRDSSFSEIGADSGLEMYGYYEGEIFIASRVIIEVYE